MFKISTAIIKGQVPGVTLAHLIHFYKSELQIQSVSSVSVNSNTISFSNNLYKFIINRYSNKFSSFSSGQIKIADTGKEFIIDLEANMTRLFLNTGIIAIAVTCFFLFGSGFNVFPLVLGLIVFVLLTLIGYIFTKASFPVYFVNLRNKIQQELELMKE